MITQVEVWGSLKFILPKSSKRELFTEPFLATFAFLFLILMCSLIAFNEFYWKQKSQDKLKGYIFQIVTESLYQNL